MTQEQVSEIRALARETYKKTCINRPHMPDADSDEGQRKIDRLFDIMTVTLSSAVGGCACTSVDRADCKEPNCGFTAPSAEQLTATPDEKPKPFCIFCGKRVFGPCQSKAQARGCELPSTGRETPL